MSAPSLLTDVFAELEPIYEALSRRGIAPTQVDECEIWQVATMLGIGRDGSSSQRAPSNGTTHYTGDELLRQRVLHAQGKAPKPEAAPVPADHPVISGVRTVR